MAVKSILFIGGYPNEVDKYKRVFYQNLIFAMSDKGIECTVISPVSYTAYKNRISEIKRYVVQKTAKGNPVYVYYPRYISVSAKKIDSFNTGIISECLFELCALKEAKRLSKKFDCVYGHFFLSGGLAAIKAGNYFKMPSFIAYGECDYESQVKALFRDLTNKDIAGITGIISVSGKNTDELKQIGLFNNTPIITCPNAIDLTSFKKKDKVECRKKFGFPEDKFIVGFVGGFIERKGHKRLLAACSGMKDVCLAFAGKGEDKPEGSNVIYAEALPHEYICDFLNAVDVFVLPTLNEGCSNAIVEAMACGLPVISSNLPFNDDILNDENSIRIDPNSIEEIKNAIIRLINDKAMRDKLSLAAAETAKELTIERRADKILDFIEINTQ